MNPTTKAEEIKASNLVTAQASVGVALIADERRRQIEREGWSASHDDEHNRDELALAAATYALPPKMRGKKSLGMWQPSRSPAWEMIVPTLWPWEYDWWKPEPNDRVRELVKAGALIAAEIDRLRRLPTGAGPGIDIVNEFATDSKPQDPKPEREKPTEPDWKARAIDRLNRLREANIHIDKLRGTLQDTLGVLPPNGQMRKAVEAVLALSPPPAPPPEFSEWNARATPPPDFKPEPAAPAPSPEGTEDIVARLKDTRTQCDHQVLRDEAAREIKSLRAANQKLLSVAHEHWGLGDVKAQVAAWEATYLAMCDVGIGDWEGHRGKPSMEAAPAFVRHLAARASSPPPENRVRPEPIKPSLSPAEKAKDITKWLRAWGVGKPTEAANLIDRLVAGGGGK